MDHTSKSCEGQQEHQNKTGKGKGCAYTQPQQGYVLGESATVVQEHKSY